MTAGPGVPGLLRTINDRAALDLLLEHGELSRTALSRLTGLSHPTTTRMVSRLEAAGLVVEAGLKGGRKGPYSLLYRIRGEAAHVAAVDVTPQRIHVAITDLAGRTAGVHRLTRSAAERAGAAPARVRRALSGALRPLGLAIGELSHVVVGAPGSIDARTGRLNYAEHLPGWQEPGLADAIEEVLGVPVEIENDVKLATMAEHRTGAGVGRTDFALFWMGEGLGVGVVMDGALRRGAGGGAGEVSYLPVPGRRPSRSLRHGDAGDFQSRAGAAAVVELAREHGVSGPTAEEAMRTASPAFLRELAVRVAEGLAAAVCLLDPEAIVICGPVGVAGGPQFASLVHEELAAITITTPDVLVSTVEGNPVLAGATLKALDVARDRIFPTAPTAS